ncbi:MAG: hypothetical protein CMF52_00860 [Legionellales bacterium]|nr:hypothetical protein [Legionellales bacterium]|tara:strand:- start:1051 stop:2175 length:1125 start_codon:yes stop_codon:yes gene_type:complete
MNGQHYRVCNKTFTNYYSALLETKRTGQFAEFVLPDVHLDAIKSVNLDEIKQATNKSLMTKKLLHLKDIYGKLRLHYSGGSDSQTILDIADRAGIVWDSVFMWLTNTTGDFTTDDREFAGAYEFIKQNKHLYRDLEIYRFSERDYEVWFDQDVPQKYTDFYQGFRPTWDQIYARDLDNSVLNVQGAEKPVLYKTQSSYYWIQTDMVDSNLTINTCDFFQDSIFPKLAVKQAYSAKDYFENLFPDRTGWLGFQKDPDYNNISKYLGLSDPVEEWLKTNKADDPNRIGGHNNKSHLAIKNIQELGRQDIVDAYLSTSEHFIRTFKDIPHGIHTDNIYIQGIGPVTIGNRVLRIGAIFQLNDSSLELLPHTDINLLT